MNTPCAYHMGAVLVLKRDMQTGADDEFDDPKRLMSLEEIRRKIEAQRGKMRNLLDMQANVGRDDKQLDTFIDDKGKMRSISRGTEEWFRQHDAAGDELSEIRRLIAPHVNQGERRQERPSKYSESIDELIRRLIAGDELSEEDLKELEPHEDRVNEGIQAHMHGFGEGFDASSRLPIKDPSKESQRTYEYKNYMPATRFSEQNKRQKRREAHQKKHGHSMPPPDQWQSEQLNEVIRDLEAQLDPHHPVHMTNEKFPISRKDLEPLLQDAHAERDRRISEGNWPHVATRGKGGKTWPASNAKIYPDYYSDLGMSPVPRYVPFDSAINDETMDPMGGRDIPKKGVPQDPIYRTTTGPFGMAEVPEEHYYRLGLNPPPGVVSLSDFQDIWRGEPMNSLDAAWQLLKLSGNTKICDSCGTTFGNLPEDEDTCKFCGGTLRYTR